MKIYWLYKNKNKNKNIKIKYSDVHKDISCF